MTRRDFQLIADVVRELRESFGDALPADRLIHELGTALYSTNGRFDRGRFERACEPTRVGYIIPQEAVDAKRAQLEAQLERDGAPLEDLASVTLEKYAREAIDPDLRARARRELAMRARVVTD